MATKPVTAPEEINPADAFGDSGEWETISVGLGQEHNPEEKGVLIGRYEGFTTKDVEDKQNGGTRPTNAYQFINSSGELIFCWGSYAIDEAFTSSENPINKGDLVRIEFLGRETFSGDKGPQVVKNFRVQVKRA